MTRLDEARFEELGDRWLQGEESALEELRAMAAADPALALELRLLEASRAELERATEGAERAMLERVFDRVTTSPKPGRPTLRRVLLVAAALLILVGTAAAAYWAGTRSTRFPAPAEALAPAEAEALAPAEAEAPGRSSSAPPGSMAVAAQDEEAVEVEGPQRPAELEESPSKRSRAGLRASAAELFERAGERRAQGRVGEAARLYRELQRRYPRSPEAQISRLSLARLLLRRLGDPRGALGQLDAYLQAAPSGPLAPECRYQRAVALRRLGRVEDERQALELLLRRDPGSVYVPAARRRLEELAVMHPDADGAD